MRFELAGSLVHPAPIILTFTSSQNFDPTIYIAKGYTNFDVVCIGGGGGMGGGIDTANAGTLIRSYGGAGGGGGYHRVRGLLSALPSSCPVVVGAGGALGTEHASNPASTTNGGDGGASTFNTNTCRASGGQGGRRVQSNSLTVTTLANGGDGGIGDRIIAGGGGAGGVAGTPTATGPGTAGTIGATAGGRGSFNPGDTSVYAPGGSPSADPSSLSASVMPGYAGGAKASPVNGLPLRYGNSKGTRAVGDPGVVILRLTAQ
jgi:hypothetical protein